MISEEMHFRSYLFCLPFYFRIKNYLTVVHAGVSPLKQQQQQFYTMRIVTWNINGIRTFRGGIKKALDSLDADIICVQETKVTSKWLAYRSHKSGMEEIKA